MPDSCLDTYVVVFSERVDDDLVCFNQPMLKIFTGMLIFNLKCLILNRLFIQSGCNRSDFQISKCY